MTRKHNPDDWFSQDWNLDDLFGSLDAEFRRMRRTMDEMMRDAAEGNLPEADRKSPFVWGFSMRTGPDGRPQFEEFGNTSDGLFGPKTNKATVETTSREPLTDTNETEDEVAITVELPGVSKADIDIDATEKEVTIKVETDARNYFKQLPLKSKIIPDSAKATYTNGILDLVLKKQESEKPQGTKIKVD